MNDSVYIDFGGDIIVKFCSNDQPLSNIPYKPKLS